MAYDGKCAHLIYNPAVHRFSRELSMSHCLFYVKCFMVMVEVRLIKNVLLVASRLGKEERNSYTD